MNSCEIMKGRIEFNMKIEELKSYEILEKRRIDDINSMSYLLKHKKTGAYVALLENDDENKVFNIAFRTPPANSTGVAHIIEHTVLCGSTKFPSKDPFMELEKSSLNTFLNAMTYPDKTMYPLASCNDTDFQNLMDVYLDAVFHPNIYKEKKIFMQEGWHYEMEDAEDELTINGVVYNEMKGAFSSADDVLYREITTSLYPDITYGMESGGDPDVIPELSYEEYLDFHRKYYHPSNSYIYLYGNMDMAEKLDWIDREYLSEYDYLEVDSDIALQKPFTSIKEDKKYYSISENESEQDNTYLSYNISLGSSLDARLYRAFDILDYVLCSSKGAPVKEALIHKGIGTEVYSDYSSVIKQPYFSFVAKNANESDKEAFLSTIKETLEELVKNGIDQKALMAGIAHAEFHYREADFGNYPKGLMYGLQMFDSWLYDKNAPFIHIEANDTFAFLKSQVSTGYFEKLIEEYMLHNTHSSLLILAPKKGLTEEKDQALADQLAALKASMSEEEIQTIVKETKDLLTWQETEDSKEVLAKIPTLTRADIKKQAEPLTNELRKIEGNDLLFHNVFTNGIGYVRLVFSLKDLPGKYYPYLGILKNILYGVDTSKHTYGELNHEMNTISGGLSFGISTYTNATDYESYMTTFEVKTKALYENMENTISLVREILFESKLESSERIREILEEVRSRMEADFVSSGHVTAVNTAESYFSKPAMIGEIVSGIPAYKLIVSILNDYENEKQKLMTILQEMIDSIFRKENLLVDVTAEEEGVQEVSRIIPDFINTLSKAEVLKEHFEPVLSKNNEGLCCASQVQYVCRAGNFARKGLTYSGSLRVTKSILGREYLWNNVRVKNGAYGCMCSFRQAGDSYFVSYRDPKLKETVDVYEKAADYIANYDGSEDDITKFIIGTISDIDIPLTPSQRGSRSMAAYLSNYSFEQIQKERDEILATTKEDIRKTAKIIEAFLSDDCFCVVGNEAKIKEDAALFKEVKPLIEA